AADIPYLVYTPNDFFQGPDTFSFQVQDSGGTANGGSDTSSPVAAATMTINVKTNDAPVAVASSTVTNASHAHTFAAADFRFVDPTDASEPLKAVIIDQLPGHGVLKLMLPGTF